MKSSLFHIAFLFVSLCLQAQANFTADVKVGCGPLTVQFRDLSINAKSWQWDLGNGNQSTLKNPSAIYNIAGYYDIELKITDSFGNTYQKSIKNFIQVFFEPKPYFVASKKKLCPNDTLTFYNQSTAGDAAIVSYKWDFGDGNNSALQNPVHQYTGAGFKNVSLIATDANGCSAQKKFTSFIQVWNPPTADFSLDTSLSCRIPVKVNFTSNVFPGGLKHSWDFGNGNTSTTTNPSEIYKKYGKYNVKLTVTDNNGCIGTKTKTDAVVIDNISLAFSAKNTTLCDTSDNAIFTNSSNIYSGYNWKWDFGDGNYSFVFAPEYKYHTYGNFSVILSVTGPNCALAVKRNAYIKVTKNPSLKIRGNDTGACNLPFDIYFHANTSPTATVYWEFGDNKNAYGKDILHTYNKDDTFFVLATATEINGCRSFDSAYVHMNFLSTLVKGTIEGCVPFDMKVYGEIYETSDALTSEKWYLNRQYISSGNSFSHYFKDTGTYALKYVATNGKGCVDTPTYFVKVGYKVKAGFYVLKKEVCISQDVTCINTTDEKYKGIQYFWASGEGITATTKDFTTRFKYTQANAPITLIANHMGCRDTFKTKDSVFILAPRVGMDVPYLTCKLPDSIRLTNSTSAYNKLIWTSKPAYMHRNDQEMWISKNNSNYEIFMYARNDTTGCEDSFKYNINLNVNQPDSRAYMTILDTCLPAKIYLKDNNSSGEKIYWVSTEDTNKIENPELWYTHNNFGEFDYFRIAENKSIFQVCADTTRLHLVLPKPDTRSSASPVSGCTPHTVTLVDSGYFTGKKAFWTIGDSVIWSKNFKTNYTIKTPPDSGKLLITFTAFDSLQRCSATKDFYLDITGPTAEIQYLFNYNCKTTRVDFSWKKNPSVIIVSNRWIIDDTFRSSLPSFSYSVPNVKLLRVVLEITDNNGCKSEIVQYVYTRVFKPQIHFNSDVKGALCPPVTVQFQDSSFSFNNPIEQWWWDFGDGATSTIKNPVHTYLGTGKYTVTLRVKNFVGCFATDSFPAFIDVKGPKGKITTGSDSGCSPWKVQFKTTAKYLKDVVWDYGDGTIGNGVISNHVFATSGSYRPSAILEDSAGCKIGIISDTILYGLKSAKAAILQSGFCENSRIYFDDKSTYPGVKAKNSWQLDNTVFSGPSFFYDPVAGKKDTIKFIAYGPIGCNDTLNYIPKKSFIDVKETHNKDTLCPGDLLRFADVSVSDTNFIYRKWVYNWEESLDSVATYTAKIPGTSDLTLMLRNAWNCLEIKTWKGVTITGDTIAPNSTEIITSSVLPDNKLQLHFHKTNNFDFRNYVVYDATNWPEKIQRKIYNSEDTLISISGLDVLHNSYCYKVTSVNFCKMESNPATAIAHCQVNLQATPDQNSVQLNWNNYTGNNTVTYALYRRTLPTGSENFITNIPANTNAYTDSNVNCKTPYSYRLESMFSNVSEFSSSDTSNATPIYVTRLNPPYIKYATVLDEKSVALNLDTGFVYQKTATLYFIQRKTNDASFTDWKQLPVRSSYILLDNNLHTDRDRFYYRVASGDGCSGTSIWSEITSPMLLSAQYDVGGKLQLNWNHYHFWPGNIARYEVEIKSADGTFETVHQTSNTTFEMADAGNTCGATPVFRIKAISNINAPFADANTNQISWSNELAIHTEVSAFVPNVFTPNHNQLNEIFKPVVTWAKDYEMYIYDRWGGKIGEFHGCGSGWDGTINGSMAPAGTYAYRLKVTAANGLYRYFTGSLLLLR
ncbi:MAG: PKD domain-containing protein [Bacteroidetes bacterium]|nr:PKD domain-containing protein [Bacteroidota bacterium]